jgi:cytochrome c-type biogenesis protein CcmH
MMRSGFFALLLTLALATSWSARAAIDVYSFDSDAQEQTFRELTKELRCPKCQNQDIADSNAGLAKDLRDKTYLMVHQGKDKQEIIDYMVARYGNFILYDPPMMASTLILWLGPFGVIVIGFCVVAARARKRPESETALQPGLNDEESRRLAALLKEEEKQ